MSTLSATSKQCFEQPAASFLVCSLIFIEYQIPPATQEVSLNSDQIFQCLTLRNLRAQKQPSVD